MNHFQIIIFSANNNNQLLLLKLATWSVLKYSNSGGTTRNFVSVLISIETLNNLKASLKNGLIIHVFVKNMDDFARVNSVYKTFITVNPPARQVTA